MREAIRRLEAARANEEKPGEAAAEAITAEMVEQMLINSPLRSAQSFLGMSRAEADALLEKLQKAAQS